MLTEGVIFRWLANIWGTLKGGMANPTVQEWAKTRLAPKGLDDESVFSFVLAKADMKGKKLELVRVLNQLEATDKVAGTRYVRNFRLIVAMDAIGRGKVKVEKKDKEGRVVEVKDIPDPTWVHPGLSILELLAEECRSDAEMIQFIMACGAMQDAPFGTLDELKRWAKKAAWPWISAQWNGLKSGVKSACQSGEQYYQGLEASMDDFDSQPLWQKIFNPRNWFLKF